MLRLSHALQVLAVLSMFFVIGSAGAAVTPTKLHCEYATNPLGIDTPKPALGWQLQSDERGHVQTAYQILVASSEEQLAAGTADLWDSGKVASNESVQIVYNGKPLRSGMRAFWKVRVWDKLGKESQYSEPAWWEMALLEQADWRGKWITNNEPEYKPEQLFEDHPAPLFRKEFTAGGKIKSARLYISGLGYYEATLNGKRVGDHVLDPGWTSYAKRVLYSTYDVTSLLKDGPNAIGVILGNGWYNPLPLKMWGKINLREHLTIGKPRLIAQLNIEYADGTRTSVVTDESWKTSDSPIVRNSVYLGEVYDAQREQPAWDTAGFDDGKWQTARLATSSLGPLRTQSAEPIRITRTLKPVSISEPKPGIFIADMGQNYAGWVRLRVSGPKGTKVTLRYGELLHKDGTLNEMTSVAGQIKRAGMSGPGAPPVAYQSETYILKGEGVEEYTPRFTFHGFRYVELTGYPGKPDTSSLEGLALNSDVASAGEFSCSNEMFNRIQKIVRWTLLSNLFSVESDCPHREKFGYGGDIMAAGEMAIFNYDMARFYAKTVYDYSDAARPNGGLTETAPYLGIADDGFGDGTGPIGWDSALPIVPWYLYQYYGNRTILAQEYETMKRYVDFLASKAKDNIIDRCIGDHETLAPKSVPLTSTAFYYNNVVLLSRIAGVLGKTDDHDKYIKLAEQIRKSFNAKFLKPGTGHYDTATQANQAFALYFDLVPPEEKKATLDSLVDDVLTKNKGHLNTGIFGTKYMLNALTDLGRADVANTIVSQKTFPGWGHMLEGGATTLWEHWEFSDNVYSHNHPMFGSVSEWFFKAPGGINPAPDAVGFDKIVIRPQILDGLEWTKAKYDSIRGPIVCEWKRETDSVTITVAIPANCTAMIHIPAASEQAVTEGDTPAAKSPGIKSLGVQNGSLVLEAGSGRYRFVVKAASKHE